jgi:hypothetical protein
MGVLTQRKKEGKKSSALNPTHTNEDVKAIII